MLTPSSIDARSLLLAQLKEANEAVAQGADPLDMADYSLVCVIRSLENDPVTGQIVDTALLRRLAVAVRDLRQGAQPDLLKRSNKPGRPKHTSFEAARGSIAFAAEILMRHWNRDRAKVKRFLSTELRKFGIKDPSGSSITGEQALRWRDEMGGYSTELAQSTFDANMKRYETLEPTFLQDEKVVLCIVEGILRALPAMGF